MGVTYEFKSNLFVMTLDGVCPMDELFDTFDRALEDSAFPENARFLMDVSASESLADRTVEELRQVVDHFSARAERIGNRCALVAQSPVLFGMMRMAMVFSEMHGVNTSVFKSVDEAADWLKRDLPATGE
jgi:hypothetical protein